MQNKTDDFFPWAPMRRLIFKIAQEFIQDETFWQAQVFRDGIRFSKVAMWMIQEDLKSELSKMFQEVNLLAIGNGRQTILARDIKLAKELRAVQFNGAYNWAVTRVTSAEFAAISHG